MTNEIDDNWFTLLLISLLFSFITFLLSLLLKASCLIIISIKSEIWESHHRSRTQISGWYIIHCHAIFGIFPTYFIEFFNDDIFLPLSDNSSLASSSYLEKVCLVLRVSEARTCVSVTAGTGRELEWALSRGSEMVSQFTASWWGASLCHSVLDSEWWWRMAPPWYCVLRL